MAKKVSYKLLWKDANKYIPGGNMLFSKRPELYLPDKWPTYYKKAKGCIIWDLNNKRYFDLSMMGIGTNVLGYAHSKIDNAVKKAIDSSNMSTFNSYEEVELAKKLIKLHKWSSKVKFARTGGEANAIAVRIARAATKSLKIAICGYHGWHDWYLALNKKGSKKLNNHLMEGIKAEGVPKVLSKYIYSFNYNDYESLKYLIEIKKIKIIKMEVIRNIEPKNNFLSKVKKLCEKNKCLLIFDECTSGFRLALGGLHKKFRVNPDICIFGKALGNGYPITAIIGREEVMKFANNSFISSTFWSDRIGSVAALETIKIFEKTKAWKEINKKSKLILKRWKQIAKKTKVEIETFGLNGIVKFKFKSNHHNLLKTFLTQEMLNKKFLATNAIYVSISHTDIILNKYFNELEKVFKKIRKIQLVKNYHKMLDLKKTINDFKRFN